MKPPQLPLFKPLPSYSRSLTTNFIRKKEPYQKGRTSKQLTVERQTRKFHNVWSFSAFDHKVSAINLRLMLREGRKEVNFNPENTCVMEIRIVGYGLGVRNYELRVKSYGLQVTKRNRVMVISIQSTTLTLTLTLTLTCRAHRSISYYVLGLTSPFPNQIKSTIKYTVLLRQ